MNAYVYRQMQFILGKGTTFWRPDPILMDSVLDIFIDRRPPVAWLTKEIFDSFVRYYGERRRAIFVDARTRPSA